MEQAVVSGDYVESLGLSKKRELVEFLVKSESDLTELQECVKRSKNKPILGLLEFRRNKVVRDMMSKDDFVTAYNVNSRDALEALFRHPVSEYELDHANERIHKDVTLLGDLYRDLCNNPYSTLIRLVG